MIAFDQEAGITSDMAAIMCEKLNITRELGGSHGHSAALVAERRLAILKRSSLKASREAERQGLLLDKEMIVIESTMVTNFMMVYNGYTLVSALLGRFS